MIQRYRSLEQMNEAQRVVPEKDPERLVRRVTDLYALAGRLCSGAYTGVHKFRSMEESNEFRLGWMRARAARMRGPGA